MADLISNIFSICGVVIVYLLSFLPALALAALFAGIIIGGMKLAGRRSGEWMLAGGLALFLLLTGWRIAETSFQFQYRRINMEKALVRCGTLLKEGKKAELQRRLKELTASKGFQTSNAYELSAAFRSAVSNDDAQEWQTADARERRYRSYAAAAVGLGIWLVFVLIWGLLYVVVHKPEPRRIFLVVSAALVLVLLAMTQVALMVGNGYSLTGYRHDIRKFTKVLEQPELPPDLLPMLENPHAEAFSYLGKLPAAPEKIK